jgi:hypothetical protein
MASVLQLPQRRLGDARLAGELILVEQSEDSARLSVGRRKSWQYRPPFWQAG